MAKSFLQDDSGVSVIIGAMLLILITIVAAAGLALIVSQSEKQAADRQALQSAVDNEKLKVASISITNGSNGFIAHVKVDIMNMNTADSKVIAISLNGFYAKDFKSVDGSITYGINNPLVIPAGRDATIDMDLEDPGHFVVTSPDPPQIPVTDTIKVELTTSYINYFSRVYTPPIASAKINVGTENIGSGNVPSYRDYLVLDGSESSSQNGSILSWDWTVYDQNGNYPYYFNGRTVRAQLNSIGPFTVTLKVTDDSKLIGTTTIQMPADQNFDKLGSPVNVNLDPSTDDILVNLVDIYNNYMGGVKITWQAEDSVNGPKYTPLQAYTDQYGYAKLTHVSGGGKVDVTIANGSSPVVVPITVP